jgi:hypothetical protein
VVRDKLNLVVSLETPSIKFSDFTLDILNSRFPFTTQKEPQINDFPGFNDAETAKLTTESDEHTEQFQYLLNELRLWKKTIENITIDEVARSLVVYSYLAAAVSATNQNLRVIPQRELKEGMSMGNWITL